MRGKIILAVMLAAVLTGCASLPFAPGGSRTVALYLNKPNAKRVQFASSLDGFRLHDTRRSASGRWEIDMPAGREFTYFYVVDGRRYVPACRFTEKDDFGSRNCIYLP